MRSEQKYFDLETFTEPWKISYPAMQCLYMCSSSDQVSYSLLLFHFENLFNLNDLNPGCPMVPDVFIYLNTGGDCIYLCKIPVVTVVPPRLS